MSGTATRVAEGAAAGFEAAAGNTPVAANSEQARQLQDEHAFTDGPAPQR